METEKEFEEDDGGENGKEEGLGERDRQTDRCRKPLETQSAGIASWRF
jgi:hypothetical protein